MSRPQLVAVVPVYTLLVFIQEVRTLGYISVAQEFENMLLWAAQDSCDLPNGQIRLQKDQLLVVFATFYTLRHQKGQRFVQTFGQRVGLLIDEDDLALARNGIVPEHLLHAVGGVAPKEKICAAWRHRLQAQGHAIAAGDLAGFSGGLTPFAALAQYIRSYSLLTYAELKGLLTVEDIYPPHQIKIFLGLALAKHPGLPDPQVAAVA